jgi:hypothetical protein
MHTFWLTIQLDPQRTQDIRIHAHSPWAARWLLRQLIPNVVILQTRHAHAP